MYKTRCKNIAILSGYVRYRPRNHSFYLMINSRILSKHLTSLRTKFKGKVYRKKNLFFLDLNEKGNILQIRDKEITLCTKPNKVFSKREIEFLKNPNTKFSFPVKVVINPKQLNLNKYYFYPDKDAAKLAYNLEKLRIIIPNRIITSHSFKHDLEFIYRGKNFII